MASLLECVPSLEKMTREGEDTALRRAKLRDESMAASCTHCLQACDQLLTSKAEKRDVMAQ